MLRPLALAASTLAACALTGCGDDGGSSAAPSKASSRSSLPPLAQATPARGELVFSGQNSPTTSRPFELDGRYVVRFEQFAPEDPRLDFSSQTPFTAELQRRAGDPEGAVKLFGEASAAGRRELTLRGRYVLDVSFGDFPYAVRFTPQR